MSDTPTIDVTDFARYCGPFALADVLGVSAAIAAHMLAGIQKHRGSTVAPGTDDAELVLALSMYNIGVERFDPRTGLRVESAAECVARARLEPPRQKFYLSTSELLADVREVISASPAASQPQLAEHFRRRHDGLPLFVRLDGADGRDLGGRRGGRTLVALGLHRVLSEAVGAIGSTARAEQSFLTDETFEQIAAAMFPAGLMGSDLLRGSRHGLRGRICKPAPPVYSDGPPDMAAQVRDIMSPFARRDRGC